jgi:hypothetical protein
VSDFRAEGFGEGLVSDMRLMKLIRQESEWLEGITKRFFEPRYIYMRVDGTHSRRLILGHVPIAIEGIKVGDFAFEWPPPVDNLVVYNRHLKGMVDPDDRHVPRIEIRDWKWVSDTFWVTWGAGLVNGFENPPLVGRFPLNSQNIIVSGIYGYTEADPYHSPLGQAPAVVREAILLLVKRKLPRLTDDNALWDAQEGHRVTSISTRGQTISFAPHSAYGAGSVTAGTAIAPWSGDPTIDRLIARVMPPLRMTVA